MPTPTDPSPRGLQLLRSSVDWDAHRHAAAAANAIDPAGVLWGKGPASYPCLVATRMLDARTAVTCYVYPDDARRLAEAAEASRPAAAAVAAPAAAQGDDFLRSLAAHTLTVADVMIRTGLCNREQYEQWYTGFLALVDQDVARRKHEAFGPAAVFAALDRKGG